MSKTDPVVDWTTRVWKWFDHNVGITAAVVFAGVLFTMSAAGCVSGTAIDPVTGEDATAAEIEASVTNEVRDIDRQIVALAQQRAQIDAKIMALNDEADALVELGQSRVDEAIAETEARVAFGQNVIEAASQAIPGFGQFAPILAGLLGGGLLFDNYRKGRVIKRKKKQLGEE